MTDQEYKIAFLAKDNNCRNDFNLSSSFSTQLAYSKPKNLVIHVSSTIVYIACFPLNKINSISVETTPTLRFYLNSYTLVFFKHL